MIERSVQEWDLASHGGIGVFWETSGTLSSVQKIETVLDA